MALNYEPHFYKVYLANFLQLFRNFEKTSYKHNFSEIFPEILLALKTDNVVDLSQKKIQRLLNKASLYSSKELTPQLSKIGFWTPLKTKSGKKKRGIYMINPDIVNAYPTNQLIRLRRIYEEGLDGKQIELDEYVKSKIDQKNYIEVRANCDNQDVDALLEKVASLENEKLDMKSTIEDHMQTIEILKELLLEKDKEFSSFALRTMDMISKRDDPELKEEFIKSIPEKNLRLRLIKES